MSGADTISTCNLRLSADFRITPVGPNGLLVQRLGMEVGVGMSYPELTILKVPKEQTGDWLIPCDMCGKSIGGDTFIVVSEKLNANNLGVSFLCEDCSICGS